MTTALERPPARDLDTLAVEIRDHHEAAQAAFRTSVEEAVLCGEKLIEAKAQLPHGGWLPWLERNFPASPRTAQGYMRLARHEDAQALAHLGVEGALRQLAAPRHEPQDGGVSIGEVIERARAVAAWQSEMIPVLEARAADPRPLTRDQAATLDDVVKRHDRMVAAVVSDADDLGIPGQDESLLLQLEDQVRCGLGALRWRLCCAYNRRAHTALGYSKWEDYARAEFGPTSSQWPEPIAGMMLGEVLAVGAGDPVIALPPLDAATEAALRESIRRFGVLVPVVRDQHGRTLDGYYRSRIARELGIDYRVDVIAVSSDDEARQIALSLNGDRT